MKYILRKFTISVFQRSIHDYMNTIIELNKVGKRPENNTKKLVTILDYLAPSVWQLKSYISGNTGESMRFQICKGLY